MVDRVCWCGACTSRFVGEFEIAEHHASQQSGPVSSANTYERFRLVECTGCGVLALHPQPDDAQLERAYSTSYYGLSRRKFVAPIAAAVSLFQNSRARRVAKAVPPGGSILDVGCGNGGFLLEMKRRGFNVQGTEWTAASASRIPTNAGVQVHAGDLLDLDLPQETFDAITLWHVFEHLRQPREALERIRALLKPTGRLFMSMPNAESTQAWRFGMQWFHHDPPRHLFAFGPHSATLLLEDAGFRVERISTWSFEQNPFGEIQSMLNAAAFPRDRLYSRLKGASSDSRTTGIADMMRMLAIAPVAVVRDMIDSAKGVGATMTIESCLQASM